MATEVKDIRVKWQAHRQALLRADYNHADENLAFAMHFAEHNPLIAGILNRLRSTKMYQQFDAEEWRSNRGHANVMGAGNTSLGFSLDEEERTAQNLKVLEMACQVGDGGLLSIGELTYGGSSTKFIDYIHSAISVLFDPFYQYIDDELRSMESLISPTDIMNQIQSLVDGAASFQYPQTHKLLADAYQQLFNLSADSSGKSWYQSGYSCRHVLIQFANEIFDPDFVPEGQEQPRGDDAKTKLKWAVRYYLKQGRAGNKYRDAIESIIQANWDFVNSLGHRQKSANEEDARLAVVYTYLTISILDQAIKKVT